ncbi:DUF61 family protein [Pyrococcus horikoshii]|uniref:UPF0216 protein PH0358 n=2 Tax=Pyrococcus horikoshii TaxID=53953 RepID=Y358_PYRHO|nr:DUF61 family protein [Pyrococcus horikoshii]O58096.1 RecName: Full=UPF0216 protein PH0358 [Pyrococcus horikoshii OT3]BAA29432.1 136aa long hypothetical protein [Pyrococcus horikoshii OT3]HII61070.1 DUF61 family protein [Pyrococcus horikoshii]
MEKIEKIIEFEIARINSHLPRARRSLKELLEMKEAKVTLRDGSEHYFKREELKLLANLLDEDEISKLKLPIVIEISTLERDKIMIRGRVEVKVIKKVLGLEEGYLEENVLKLPRYYLAEIRRKLPTTTVHAFIVEW